MILIVHTTHYRTGSAEFARIAATMQDEIRRRFSGEVRCIGIFGKKELADIFRSLAESGMQLDEFHFIGHAGMYGPMYGTMDYPEQYSPYEWKTMTIPFAPGAKAYFHCCRSARWFAPFFARQFGVETFGYHWYTAFSADKRTFRRIRPSTENVYAAGCIGKKSHGWKGSLKKYSGSCALEELKKFNPVGEKPDTTYDRVAELYDAAFRDIKVRRDEWKWLSKHLGDLSGKTVIDIGCGNGALMKELLPKAGKCIGLDISPAIVRRAEAMNSDFSNAEFRLLNGPSLPLEDHSVDVVVSLLSFRYLDWDPLMDELRRVLKPGGKILIVDMITVPVKWHEYPKLLRSKWQYYLQRIGNRSFHRDLSRLVTHPDWKTMLEYNPIRAEHEMKWYLESRFPGRKAEKINVGWNSGILAFDSGNIANIQDIHLTYP
jgi:ubiquinone/menaquinone biosynthesis C-methylase UbiE